MIGCTYADAASLLYYLLVYAYHARLDAIPSTTGILVDPFGPDFGSVGLSAVLQVVRERDPDGVRGTQEVLSNGCNPAAIGDRDWTLETMGILNAANQSVYG